MLLKIGSNGVFCERGGFAIDPWRPVEIALLTHAHSDHARFGSSKYYCAEKSVPLVRSRFRQDADIVGVPYKQQFRLKDALVSFHPAGHILGSSQIRLEVDGEVCVFSGDYKRDFDPTCEDFEVIECDSFVTEATFALPIYRWAAPSMVAKMIVSWWDDNVLQNRPSVLFCYSLGKAQRILSELWSLIPDRQVFTHGAVESMTEIYRNFQIPMLATEKIGEAKRSYNKELILAPPSAEGTPWMRRFQEPEVAFASGWMQVRGSRRRRGFDRGFVFSDHADWNSLLRSIHQSKAKEVYATHGYSDAILKYLRETTSLKVDSLRAAFSNEAED